MDQTDDLFSRVTSIRVEAFELIRELSHAVETGEADPLRTLALVRLQAVANSLGRIQGDLRLAPYEPARVVDL